MQLLGARFATPADKRGLSKAVFAMTRPQPKEDTGAAAAQTSAALLSTIDADGAIHESITLGQAAVSAAVSAILACHDAAAGVREIEELTGFAKESRDAAACDTSDSEDEEDGASGSAPASAKSGAAPQAVDGAS
jgi:hypothetical protein